MPVTEDELIHHLDASAVEKGKVIETAELKAIRENILQVRMTTWLQLPKEEPWLTGFLQTCRRELARLWSADGDLEKARAPLGMDTKADGRAWLGAHRGNRRRKTYIPDQICRKYPRNVLTCDRTAPKVRDNYRSWTEERISGSASGNRIPEVYRDLLESYKSYISHVVDKYMTEIKNDDDRS